MKPSSLRQRFRNHWRKIPNKRFRFSVRDSIQHAEERSKGEHHGKKIDIKKVDKAKTQIEGFFLIGSHLNGNKFGGTMSNGEYGTVDVTVETVEILRETLLEVYTAFSWVGPARPYPS